MSYRSTFAFAVLALSGASIAARNPGTPGCGTHVDRSREELYLHHQSERTLGPLRARRLKSFAAAAANTNRDFGNIAVIDDSDGVVARRNQFNLLKKTVTFQPASTGAASYSFSVADGSLGSSAADGEAKVEGIGDDDTRETVLPFSFPFFGATYRSIHINSDGNLTFIKGDGESADRSLGRLGGGPPRIAPVYTDLDPSSARGQNGIYTLSGHDRFVVTWQRVPVYSDFGLGAEQTFQATLFPDGRIEFTYDDISAGEIVTGISPGGATTATSLVPLASGSTAEFAGTIADRFSSSDAVDIATAAQKFYDTHDDAYDYLVFFNSVGVAAGDSAVAYEVTVRNHRSGYGDSLVDSGAEYGSARRLQSVMNMGPLYQYPGDPNGAVGVRGPTGDTPLTILGHEAGHLFLAFASVRDPNDPTAMPMLGRALVHWAFNFNSEASLLEGNRIQDLGAGSSPRFRTTATVQGYSPLDQYLMGFRTASEVPPTFVVTDATVPATRAPQAGISFSGTRRDVSVEDLIAVEGRRTPDSTVSQRRFRFAFVLIAAAGVQPPQDQINKVEAYRAAFEAFYAKAASDRATANTNLERAVQLSSSPAAGVLLNGTGAATVAIQSPAASPVTFNLTTKNGAASVPSLVTIPEGARQATFEIHAVREGVEELTATPADSSFETAVARIQVTGSPEQLTLEVASATKVSGAPGAALAAPVTIRVTDVNQLPYSGVPVSATVSTGSLDSAAATTDASGIAQFRWTPAASSGTFRATVGGQPAAVVTLVASPQIPANGIVNSASYLPLVAPGSFASIFGSGLTAGTTDRAEALPLPYGLSGVQVLVNKFPAQLLYVSDSQINFLVPSDIAGAHVTIEVTNAAGSSAEYSARAGAVSPGIFFRENNAGAVLIANTALTTIERPARPGDYLEIYCTGLGGTPVESTRVSIGGVQARVLSSTPLTQFPGLDQVNVVVPEGAGSGDRPLSVTVNASASNEVLIRLE